MLALLVVVFLRPLDGIEWTALAISLGFVGAGGLALWTGGAPLGRRRGASQDGPADRTPAAPIDRSVGPAAEPERPDDIDFAAEVDKPAPNEAGALAATVAALEAADALPAGAADADMLWRATQHVDRGHPVGHLEALHALAVLADYGHLAPRRLVFVPSHTEYDAALLATLTAATLTALGHDVAAGDVSVTLPGDGSQGEARIAVPVAGAVETVTFGFLWKYPPPDLFESLKRFVRADDPRELVCADIDHGTLMFAAIRPGSREALNRHFPVGYEMFGD